MSYMEEELKEWDEHKKRKRHSGPNNRMTFVILTALLIFIIAQLCADESTEPDQHRFCRERSMMAISDKPKCGWTCGKCGYFNLVDNRQITHCGLCGRPR